MVGPWLGNGSGPGQGLGLLPSPGSGQAMLDLRSSIGSGRRFASGLGRGAMVGPWPNHGGAMALGLARVMPFYQAQCQVSLN